MISGLAVDEFVRLQVAGLQVLFAEALFNSAGEDVVGCLCCAGLLSRVVRSAGEGVVACRGVVSGWVC